MKLIANLAKELRKAAKELDVVKCQELSKQIEKIMKTYEISC